MSFLVHRISNMSIQPLPRSSNLGPSSVSFNQFMRTKTELFNLKQKPIKNCKKQSLYQCKLNWINSVIFFVNLLSVLLAIMGNFNAKQDKNEIVMQCRYLIVLSIISVIVNLASIIAQSQLMTQMESELQHSHKLSSLFKKAIFQTIFLSIHPSQYAIDVQFVIIPSQPAIFANSLFTIIVYLRIFMIIKFLFKTSRYYGLRVHRILSLYRGDSTDFELLYAIKCFLRQNGLRSPFMVYGLWILIIPFLMLTINPDISNQSFTYINSAYDIIITMTTAGFGDIKHQFTIIRIIIIIVIILGSLSSSFFTLSFLKWFTLSEQEQKAFRFIKRLKIKEQIQEKREKNTRKLIATLMNKKKQKKQKDQKGIKKNKSQNLATQEKKHSKPTPVKTLQMPSDQLAHNKNFQKQQQQNLLDLIQLQNTKIQDVSSLQTQLKNQNGNFFDFYQKTNLQFIGSLKLLIQKSILTNNLLQFFLIRCERNHQGKTLYEGSQQTIRSSPTRKRVDDSLAMFDLKLKIINKKMTKRQRRTIQLRNDLQAIGNRNIQNSQQKNVQGQVYQQQEESSSTHSHSSSSSIEQKQK